MSLTDSPGPGVAARRRGSNCNIAEKEAQVLQTDRAMLHVIEYFVKSLKVTQSHSK